MLRLTNQTIKINGKPLIPELIKARKKNKMSFQFRDNKNLMLMHLIKHTKIKDMLPHINNIISNNNSQRAINIISDFFISFCFFNKN